LKPGVTVLAKTSSSLIGSPIILSSEGMLYKEYDRKVSLLPKTLLMSLERLGAKTQ
jgi:hypothetical protein